MLSKQIVLVTGGNTGIGLAVVRKLATEYPGYQILLGTRTLSKGESAAAQIKNEVPTAEVIPVQIDINSDESINAAVETVTRDHGYLDVLINNAGVYYDDTYDASTETIRSLLKRTFEVNTFGTAQATESFLPLLKKSTNPRIVFVSSGLGCLEAAAEPKDFTFAINAPAYKASKAALNMLMLHYNMLLKYEGFLINACCPGICQTDMNPELTKNGKSPAEGAKIIVELATLEKGAKSGWFGNSTQTFPW